MAVCAGFLAVGCSTTQLGQPVAATPGPSTAHASVEAPHVPAPLNNTILVRHPCSLLTTAQLGAVGITSATTSAVDQTQVSVGCEWTDRTVGVAGTEVGVDQETKIQHGLSDIYRQQKQQAYWQPVTIQGYPAVLNALTDGRTGGTCFLNLGITDSDVAVLSYQGSPGSRPCDKVQTLAALVVQALKGRA